MLWEAVRIIKIIRPGIIVFENVKSLLTHRKHKPNLILYTKTLKKIGYFNSEPFILNSLYYGVPQNRERVFTVSFLQDKQRRDHFNSVDWLNFRVSYKPLKTYLAQVNFHKRKCLPVTITNKFPHYCTWIDKKGNINSGYNRAWHIDKYCGTLTFSNTTKITDKIKVSKLTGEEAFKLMGFTKIDYNRVKKNIESDEKIVKMAGNSIVVNVLRVIFKELFEKKNNDNNNITWCIGNC